MCNRPREELSREDYRDGKAYRQFGEVSRTEFADGSTETYFGGMGGTGRTDEFGEEC